MDITNFNNFTKEEYIENLLRLSIENHRALIGETVHYCKASYGDHKVISWDETTGEYLLGCDSHKFYSNPFRIIPIVKEKSNMNTFLITYDTDYMSGGWGNRCSSGTLNMTTTNPNDAVDMFITVWTDGTFTGGCVAALIDGELVIYDENRATDKILKSYKFIQ